MNLQDEMARDHARDYAEKAEVDGLALTLELFLSRPPRRVKQDTLDDLRRAMREMQRISDHIVQVWN